MKYELELHRLLLGMLAVVLLIVIFILMYLTPYFADANAEATASLVVVLLVATALTYMGTAEGIVATQFGIEHRRELGSYLVLGLLSIVSGMYLAISDRSSLQTVAVVVSPHAFLFGIMELRLARHMQRHRGLGRVLITCGVMQLGFGLALLAGVWLSTVQVATLLGYVASLTALQLLCILFYRGRKLSVRTQGAMEYRQQ